MIEKHLSNVHDKVNAMESIAICLLKYLDNRTRDPDSRFRFRLCIEDLHSGPELSTDTQDPQTVL